MIHQSHHLFTSVSDMVHVMLNKIEIIQPYALFLYTSIHRLNIILFLKEIFNTT